MKSKRTSPPPAVKPPFNDLTYWLPRLRDPQILEMVKDRCHDGVLEIFMYKKPAVGLGETYKLIDLLRFAAESKTLNSDPLIQLRSAVLQASAANRSANPEFILRSMEALKLTFGKASRLLERLELRYALPKRPRPEAKRSRPRWAPTPLSLRDLHGRWPAFKHINRETFRKKIADGEVDGVKIKRGTKSYLVRSDIFKALDPPT